MPWNAARRLILPGLSYLLIYIALDWISFVEPYGAFGITPWSPHAGLSLALVLLTGRTYAPLLLAAPLLADIVVRGLPTPLPVAIATSVWSGSAYYLAGRCFQLPRWHFDNTLDSLRGILLLFAGAAATAAVVGIGYVGIPAAMGLIKPGDYLLALQRYWVGDVIGIIVCTPLIHLFVKGKLTWPGPGSLLRFGSILIALGMIFGVPGSAPLQLFYVLFLPVIWIALSEGLAEISLALVITQIGLMVALATSTGTLSPVLSYQLLMLVLAMTGLVTGAIVSDRRRTEQRLRLLQDAQARFNRLGSMGALSAALTHEINQPLSAAATYSRLSLDAIPPEDEHLAAARAYSVKAAEQVQRAAAVVRRVRDLLVMGRSDLSPTDPEALIHEAVSLLQPEITRAGLTIVQQIGRDLPEVLADRQQIGQVIINLLHNAIEAKSGIIRIEAAKAEPGYVEFRVQDTGPGFDSEQISHPITALFTTKPDGLGIGLALCDAIIHNHGGTFRLENAADGAVVRFTLREAGFGAETQAQGRPD